MILTLKNIGKIADAKVELNGITVIAGVNNTGKSTIGKVLFCLFNSFYKIDQQISAERRNSIERIILNAYREQTNRLTRRFNIEKITEGILNERDKFVKDRFLLQKFVLESIVQVDENFKKHATDSLMNEISDRVIQILSVSDEEIFKTVLQKKLESEFNGQINNIYFADEDGKISLKIRDTVIEVLVKSDTVQYISNSVSLKTEVIYMDDPFALDDLNKYPLFLSSNSYTHRIFLRSKLMKQTDSNATSVKNALTEIINSKKINSILAKINSVCSGEMVNSSRSDYGYKRKDSDAVLDIGNISTGLKTFVILKTLLLNGTIENNGTIVLDEPEIHLHPEWQLLFAELIVLIQKEFSMHILLNTHSPYFLHAIEVYAAKYEIADKCKYYLAENTENRSNIVDVTNNIDKIYKILARPFQDLENQRYEND